jgi:hypothetical protein
VTDRQSVEAQIPRLAAASYRVTSPRDFNYNCFAWAAGDNSHVWSPTLIGSGVFWPPGIPALPTLSGTIDAYVRVGFEVCESADLEDGIEKIAIFTDSAGEPRHAARQLPSGSWTSKLGNHVDIEHGDVKAVGGLMYGEPTVFMSRPRAPQSR